MRSLPPPNGQDFGRPDDRAEAPRSGPCKDAILWISPLAVAGGLLPVPSLVPSSRPELTGTGRMPP